MLTFHSKMVWVKSIFSCNLSFINPQSAHFGLIILKKNPVISLHWFAVQQKTSTLVKNRACLAENLVQNKQICSLASTGNTKWLRNIPPKRNAGKTQIYVLRGVKGLRWRPFQCSFKHVDLQFFQKGTLLQTLFYKNWEVLQNINFTEQCCSTASDFL